jgi:hypothetical protein
LIDNSGLCPLLAEFGEQLHAALATFFADVAGHLAFFLHLVKIVDPHLDWICSPVPRSEHSSQELSNTQTLLAGDMATITRRRPSDRR